MPSPGILSVEYLGHQEGGAKFANIKQLRQRCDLRPIWKWRRGIEKGVTAFRLEGFDLAQHKVEPLKLTGGLRLYIAPHWQPIAGLKFIELRAPPATPQTFDVPDPMQSEQSANAIHVSCSFRRQTCALPTDPLRTFGLGRWDGHNPANTGVAGEVSAQGECHGLNIDPIGLGASPTARNQETPRVEHIDIDAAVTKKTSQPESVISSSKQTLISTACPNSRVNRASILLECSIRRSVSPPRTAPTETFRPLRRQCADYPARAAKLNSNCADQRCIYHDMSPASRPTTRRQSESDSHRIYNEERPHSAIGNIPPIMLANPAGATSPPDTDQAENSRPERSEVG